MAPGNLEVVSCFKNRSEIIDSRYMIYIYIYMYIIYIFVCTYTNTDTDTDYLGASKFLVSLEASERHKKGHVLRWLGIEPPKSEHG